MGYDDLKFTVLDERGKEVECNVISLFPKNEKEGYVVVVDGETDEEGTILLKYGLLVREDDGYSLETGISENELELIKNHVEEDFIKFGHDVVNNQIEEIN